MNRQVTVDRMFGLLVSGDYFTARDLMEETITRGADLGRLLREVLLPISTIIERLHRTSRITSDAYHGARRILLRLAGELRRLFDRPASDRMLARSQFVSLTHARGVLRAKVSDGHLGRREAGIVAAEIRGALQVLSKTPRALVLDLSNVTSMSSMGILLCLEVHDAARAKGVRPVLLGVQSEPRRLLRLAGVDRKYESARSDGHLARLLAA